MAGETREVDYLIIGNSAAGVTAAEFLSMADPGASILMVSHEAHDAYGRPLISYLIEGKTDRAHLRYKDPDFYVSRDIATLFGPQFEAVSLDAQAHEAALADGTRIRYGKCLMATGSVAFVPPIEGREGKVNVHSFMTLDDAIGAWEDVAAATQAAHAAGRESRVVVIGGGLIGMKAAEALSHHADKIDVFDRSARILPAVLDEAGSHVMERLLAPHGISCHPAMSVSELIGEGGRVSACRLTDGTELPCDAVVVAVGVRPAVALAEAAGAQTGRGLIVGPDLRTTLPDVYAAGDVCQVRDTLDGSEHPLALWPNAVRQGRIAAMFMAGAPQAEPDEGSFAVNAVDFFETSLLTAGIINPAPDSGCEVRASEGAGTYAKFVLRDGKLVGYVLLNRPDDAGVYTAMIESGIDASALSPEAFDRPPLNLDFPAQARWERLHKCYPAGRDRLGWPTESGRGPQASRETAKERSLA